MPPGPTEERPHERRQQATDLHGQPRHDPDGPPGPRGDDAVVHRALRQRGEPQPRLRLGSRGGPRPGPGAGRRADRWQGQGSRLALRCDRVGQPRDQGRRRVLQGQGAAHHHRHDRAQGCARHLQGARAQGARPGHLPPGRPHRAHRPRAGPRGDRRRHRPDLDHVREQRDRDDPADRGDRARGQGARSPLPHRRDAGPRAGASTCCRRPATRSTGRRAAGSCGCARGGRACASPRRRTAAATSAACDRER